MTVIPAHLDVGPAAMPWSFHRHGVGMCLDVCHVCHTTQETAASRIVPEQSLMPCIRCAPDIPSAMPTCVSKSDGTWTSTQSDAVPYAAGFVALRLEPMVATSFVVSPANRNIVYGPTATPLMPAMDLFTAERGIIYGRPRRY